MKKQLFSMLSAVLLAATVGTAQAEMTTDAHGNVGYDTAAECDAAVQNGTAKFYQSFTHKKPLVLSGEKSVQTARIRDLGEEYQHGACDMGVGRKSGRDGVSVALQGKYVPFSPDMPINAYTDASGSVVRVTMAQCDNWFSGNAPRPVNFVKTTAAPAPAAEPVVEAVPNTAPVVELPTAPAAVVVAPYIFGTVGGLRGEMKTDANKDFATFHDKDIKAAGQVGVGVQFNEYLGGEVFYQGARKHNYKKDLSVRNEKGQITNGTRGIYGVRNQVVGARLTAGKDFGDKFRLFGKVGVAYVENSMKNVRDVGTSNGHVFYQREGDLGRERGARLSAGVGALFKFNDKLALRADFDHHFKKKNNFRCEEYLGVGVQYKF